jgi:hypothetical protein
LSVANAARSRDVVLRHDQIVLQVIAVGLFDGISTSPALTGPEVFFVGAAN